MQPNSQVNQDSLQPNWTAQVWAWIRKEAKSEWRSKYALGGISLYLVSTIFLIQVSFEKVDDRSWILLYWLAVLYTASNAVAKSFLSESSGRNLYYYSLLHPSVLIAAKMIYNFALLLILSVLGLGLYSLVLGYPIEVDVVFWIAVVVGSAAFAWVFSMVSAIASKAAQTGTLIAILGIPILIPIIRLLSSISVASLNAQNVWNGWQGILMLAASDVLILALALVLFPYLWRD
jgi:heme exporter protein B